LAKENCVAKRWKWYLRPGPVVIDLTGQAVPDRDAPGWFRRQTVEDVVPDDPAASGGDDALGHERPAEPRAVPAANQRAYLDGDRARWPHR
jgi:hypothetical protein